MKICHWILLFVLAVPSTANAQVSRRCEVQEYRGECTIRVGGNDMHIGYYQNGEYKEGYRWTKVGEDKFRDEGGTIWKASRKGQNTLFTSWQCPPRMSCGEFQIKIWN